MKTTADCYQALLDGKKLTDGNCIAYLKDGDLIEKSIGKAYFAFNTPESWEIYEEPKWYENIPEGGVLCSVFDSKNGTRRYIDVIREYLENDTFKCAGLNNPWKNAIPLTHEEIQVFMGNAPSED